MEKQEVSATPQARELISMREYARRRGVSLHTVQAAVKTGRIRLVPDADGKMWIDPFEADRDFSANTDPTKQGRRKSDSAEGESEDDSPEGETDAVRFQRAKAMRENFQAKLKELEYLEKKGKLIDAGDVELRFANIAKSVREALLRIPDRLAARLAAETDPHKIQKLLTQEIIRALEVLIDGEHKESK